jgi:hypothetical protein
MIMGIRESVIELLVDHTSDNRLSPVTVPVALNQNEFEDFIMSKTIYATGWPGNIRVIPNSNGTIEGVLTD